MLTVGAVPFLRGFAAESVAVTPSDMAAANDVEMPDDAPADSTPETDADAPADAPARIITGTAEPKQTLDDGGSTVHTYTQDGFTASFDTATGLLTITGTGTLTQSFIQSIRNTSALGSVFGGTKQPNVKKIVIDDDITEIGERAFEYFGGSTATVEVKGKVTKVNDHAFAWSTGINNVTFGPTVTEIGDYVFHQATGLQKVIFENSVRKLGSHVFMFSSVNDIYIKSPSLDSCGKMIQYNRVCNVHLPCEHFKIGTNDYTYILEHKSDYFDNAEIVNDGEWEWVTDTAPTCENAGLKHMECSGCHLKGDYAPIDPLGHDWGEWEGDPVQASTCRNDESHKEYRLNPAIRFAATAGNKSQYTLGSKKTLGLTIDRVDREDENVYTYFTNGGEVKVTGANDYSKTLTAEDFDAENGSLKITLNAAYLEGLAPGTYSLTASFKVADGYDLISSEPVSFTIVKPSPEPSSPATGESGMMTTFCIALMLLAAYGAVYAVTRRKTVISG